MKIDWAVLDNYLNRGLSAGVGDADKQVCVEAAICLALGLPLGDDPPCVAPAVRAFKIALNDGPWSSPEARAAGMRALAYAQIGTRGQLDEKKWVTRVAELTIREVLPPILREIGLEKEAKRCELEGTPEAAWAAAAARAAEAAWAAAAARAAADKYLLISADLALRALEEQGFTVERARALEEV
jgi:hypothetical protein